MLEERNLGTLTVSALGLGCMGMSWSYSPVPNRDDMVALLRAAVERGHAVGPVGVEDLDPAVHRTPNSVDREGRQQFDSASLDMGLESLVQGAALRQSVGARPRQMPASNRSSETPRGRWCRVRRLAGHIEIDPGRERVEADAAAEQHRH